MWLVIFHRCSSGIFSFLWYNFYCMNRSIATVSSWFYFIFLVKSNNVTGFFPFQSHKCLFVFVFFLYFLSLFTTGNTTGSFWSMDIANKIFAVTGFGNIWMPSEYGTKNVDGVSVECCRWVYRPFPSILLHRAFSSLFTFIFWVGCYWGCLALILMDFLLLKAILLNASIIALNGAIMSKTLYQFRRSTYSI